MAFPLVPPFPTVVGLSRYFAAIGKYLDEQLAKRPMNRQAMGSIVLIAPDGSTWEVKVSNTGVISTTQLTA